MYVRVFLNFFKFLFNQIITKKAFLSNPLFRLLKLIYFTYFQLNFLIFDPIWDVSSYSLITDISWFRVELLFAILLFCSFKHRQKVLFDQKKKNLQSNDSCLFSFRLFYKGISFNSPHMSIKKYVKKAMTWIKNDIKRKFICLSFCFVEFSHIQLFSFISWIFHLCLFASW